jgi:hypothetical protein
MQLSVAAANARLDQIEAIIGGPTIRLFTGSPPANCAAASTGTLVSEMFGVTNWLEDASGGTKVKRPDIFISNFSMVPGVIGHFRVYSGSDVCHIQGTVSLPGGGGDMTMSNVDVMPDQELSVLAITINDNTL